MIHHTTEHQGATLACRDEGAGTPLVLIHGFPFDHTMWQPQFETWSKRCRVLAPDLRGFGASTITDENVRHGVGMEQYAADVAAQLDAAGVAEPVILCGFSMGGYILWQFLLGYPERVRGIVLCDTRAAADSEQARAGRLAMAGSVAETGVEPVVTAMLPKLLAEETHQNKLELVEQTAAWIRSTTPGAISAAQRGMARREDMTARLGDFKWPALVVVGEHDAISSPAEMQGIADTLPNGRYVEVPGAGHMTVLENPDFVTAVVSEFVEVE